MKDFLLIPKVQTAGLFLRTLFAALLLTFLLSIEVYSQTFYPLPDTNFRKKIATICPTCVSVNNLNIAAAKAYSGSLDLSNSNISDVSGIQFFIKANSLNLNNNNLTFIPDISGLTLLTNFYANANKLQSLPSISTLTNLYDFQAQDNQLTSLPSFAGLSNLYSIYCQNNKITSISGISSLTNLQILDIGNNDFHTLPDFSPLISLKQLHIHQTKIDTIIGLSSLPNLEMLFAWSNNISDLSSLNANTKLKFFVVGDNNLKFLPTLSNKPLLISVDITNNYLSFEDLLPCKSLATFGAFVYSPQKPFNLTSYTLREKDNLTFNLGIDQAITTNWYTWSKNGVVTDSIQSGIKNIPSLVYADSGTYSIRVYNPNLPGLVLTTIGGKLLIKPCLEINSFSLNVVSEHCTLGSNITISSLNLGGGIGPYSYSLVSSSNADTIIASTPDFQNLDAGLYQFIVTDSRMCKATSQVSVKIPEGCEPVISPNGDGIMDTYFIEETGKTRIYDVNRNLIREFNAPFVWDGTKYDGTPAGDGYYAIVNGKKIIHITLVK